MYNINMTDKYVPLYRKYRPQILGDLVGQEHIQKALTNAIELGKIAHAYLFCGPRGTGKTSSARILAKSLNCVNGPTVKPCGVCPSCVDITNSTPIDVIEIDAASNRGVEDARNILEKIQYVAVNGKYKIYIIDEVHMLTPQAFNTLLKTLEEPPENVIFILATTEPQKVLETIVSRCQRFDFRRITTDDIIGHLKKIAKLEDIKIEDEALFTIAKNVSGGMRDSLALLDQVSVLDNSRKITSDDINNLLGKLSFDELFELSTKMINSQPQEAVTNLDKIYNKGNEPIQILTNLLGYFKNLLIIKNCAENLVQLTQLNEIQIKSLKTQAENVETHQIVFLIERISYYIKEVKFASNQQLWLEIAMIDLANLTENTSLLRLQERITALESGAPQQVKPSYNIQKPKDVQTPKFEKIPEPAKEPIKEEIKETIVIPEPVEKPEPAKQDPEVKIEPEAEDFAPMPKSQPKQEDHASLMTLWHELLSHISSPAQQAYLRQNANPVEISTDGIIISCKLESFVARMNEDSKKRPIMEAAEQVFSKKGINVLIRLPQPNDSVVEKKNLTSEVQPKKTEIPTPPPELEDYEIEEIEVDQQVASSTPATSSSTVSPSTAAAPASSSAPSDMVSMVVNLFDGKYID